ncbi:DotU family type IV/VI secretion system protein [Trinickia mobilis]|uniref:DotU family type IV/VI secretion system protein n=1 Tax=Trinickia mobilis TaxID=2816356 RepID=UPI001A8ED2E9|nr:DotU family type IV/VI secretion system protein [Trinickia mobilis]
MLDSPATSLRALLRDTALHVALLTGGAQIPAVHSWRARCIALVDGLQQAMRDAGYLDAEIDEVSLAQCTLLDDVTLGALPAAQRGDWSRESLQVRFHDTQDGAEIVCERIDVLLLGEPLTPASLEMYRLVLELGFKGGQAERESYRQRVSAALNKMGRLEDPEPMQTLAETAAAVVRDQGDTRRRLPTWGAIFAVAGAAVLWLLLDSHLDRSVARLPEPLPEHLGSLSQGRS